MMNFLHVRSRSPEPHEPTCPTPLLALSVGVIGHRPPKLAPEQVPAVRQLVKEILQHVASIVSEVSEAELYESKAAGTFRCYSGTKPVLRILSSIAEGADRLVAQEGIALDYKLQCILPASQEMYRKDFKTQESRAEYDDLLAHHVERTFELAGRREEEWLRSSDYETAGRLTLAHSDLLLAIWNGQKGEPGGTEQMIREARLTNLPVLIIYTSNPVHIEFFVGTVSPGNDWKDAVRKTLEKALIPPSSAPRGLGRFLNENPPWNFTDSISDQQGFADRAAGAAARSYRRTYKVLYFFAPLAVIFAVLGLLLGQYGVNWIPEWFCSGAEFACILAILCLTFFARYRQWHDRWLDARVIAELLRTWSFLEPLGQNPSLARHPPFVSPKAANRDWTTWYLRSRIREHGMSSGRMSPEFYASYYERLSQAIEDQIDHHHRKGHARRRVYERAELTSFVLFLGTAIICAVHLLLPHLLSTLSPDHMKIPLAVLAAFTAALPAIGSALEGLLAQGEYQRLAERAEGMEDRLEHLHQQLNAVAGQQPHLSLDYITLVHIAQDTSTVILDELSDWRNLVRVRVVHPV